ncbi:hypothetical protein HanRHA438_Chr14g0652801 [Helianthus annuus]|nr:hypothetical protein HanHA300_Chr14g0522671 [Helianthus annuus]KAJ0468444.1 hypothetical protein HanIR_Chr14g0696681 [Helianthus annuus]KAJ0485595.1 hypothetical protein HanHA89_Chr14g0570081 [Helianthus annuus]KAJ0656147.1 hypothetical protein HanLR1_Chr14g0532471 [Helianthus annuus]KAJ0659813.1 hypothetical protein HanOQP8_Chr14g0530471 [Helianthus annuus]
MRVLRFSEHGKSGPGLPLMVWASDMLGGKPMAFPCFTISSTSPCHHSPNTKTCSLSGFGNGYGVPCWGKMTIAPYTVALSQRI